MVKKRTKSKNFVQTNTFADQQVHAEAAEVAVIDDAAVVDERVAGADVDVDLAAMWRVAVEPIVYGFADDDVHSRWSLANAWLAVQRVVQTHHIQNHKFHLLPYRTDNLTAVNERDGKLSTICV